MKGDFNGIYDNSLYEVEYNYGRTEQLEDNIIAENMLSQVDYEGNHYQVLTGVTDHKNYDISIAKVDGFINSSSGNINQKRTTCGWKILLEWKDGSVDWVTLKDLMHSRLVEMAEYDVANDMSDELDFNKLKIICYKKIGLFPR